MLEIKDVTKVYRTKKGGVETRALDGVSISFGETGMVFLLGKSGSGKSTLLNVCGGLDAPTSGEIIVKGKSSRDFTASDFDSYRNTFVGFIFQEYNILDEFNVEDNIALALELQGKPKDKDRIRELLKEVDLEQFAKRKPNTLSGGQKQRIAIARALVKDPQIIMADEPTGALDSATGKQVFDTLKKLSETRLVIVVSHDREFAEIYGDRIVELKDGKIISDVTKHYVQAEQVDENVSVIGGDTISVKCGAQLSKSNIKTIEKFISDAGGSVIITRGEQEISSFKKSNRISDAGEREKFADTAADDVQIKSYEETRFIRSRLPAGKAIKIGASGLKLKPIRLFFTILLSFIAFTMFGLLSTLMVYDGEKVAASSFASSDYEYLTLSKKYLKHYTYSEGDGGYSYGDYTRFTEGELSAYRQKYGSGAFGYFSTSPYMENTGETIENIKVNPELERYYRPNIARYAYAPQYKTAQALTGAYPENAKEICISSYALGVMQACTFYNVTLDGDGAPLDYTADDAVKINRARDALGRYIILRLNGVKLAFKITGVFDSGEIPSKYNSLKNGTSGYETDQAYRNFLTEGLSLTAFVSEDFYDTYKDVFDVNYKTSIDYFDSVNYLSVFCDRLEFSEEDKTWKEKKASSDEREVLANGVRGYGTEGMYETYFFDGRADKTLAYDEIIVGIDKLVEVDIFGDLMTKYYYENGGGGDYALSESMYVDFCSTYNDVLKGGTYPQELKEQMLNEISSAMDNVPLRLYIEHTKPISAVKIAGVYFKGGDVGTDGRKDGVYFTQEFIDENIEVFFHNDDYTSNYTFEADAKYNGVCLPYDKSAGMYRQVAATIGEERANAYDVYFVLQASLYDSVQGVNEYVQLLSKVFLWMGICFALFSALLMFNFISVSISNKKKEIGILRAVGARGTDVFKIFFAESGIIVGICTALSLIGTLVICIVLNNVLKAQLGLNVTLFVFGFASVGMLVGVALVVALISTFLPVYFAARKKPVDSIRSL